MSRAVNRRRWRRGESGLFYAADSFNRIDNASLLGETDQMYQTGTNVPAGQGLPQGHTSYPWTALRGTLGISSGSAVAYGTAAGGDGVQEAVSVIQYNERDAWVRVIIDSLHSSSTNIGVIARCTDINNYYLLQCNGSAQYQLFRRVSGTYAQIGSSVVATGFAAGDEMSLRVRGSQLTCYRNEIIVIDTTDTNIVQGTLVGTRNDFVGGDNRAFAWRVDLP